MVKQEQDNTNEILTINRELQLVTEDLQKNTQYAEKLSEIENVSWQLYKDKQKTLAELAYYWKGKGANLFLNEAHQENEQSYQRIISHVEKGRSEIKQKKELYSVKEQELLIKKMKLRQGEEEGNWA